MRLQLVTDSASIPISRNEWNFLASQNETNTPFQTYEWFRSWWKVFGTENDLFLLLIYEGERVIGLAPLMISYKRNRRELKFTSDVNADYCDFITGHNKTTIVNIIFDYLLQNQSQWNSISLKNIPEYSSTSSILEEISSGYGLPFIKSSIACPVLIMKDIQSVSQWKNYRINIEIIFYLAHCLTLSNPGK